MTWTQASRAGYDPTTGRPVDSWDALDKNTHTTYTPGDGWAGHLDQHGRAAAVGWPALNWLA